MSPLRATGPGKTHLARMLNRREWLTRSAIGPAGALAVLASTASPVWARDATEGLLPMAASLPQSLAEALAARLPLVVMISLPGCPYCPVVRQSYLAPLLAAGQARVVQVDMQSRLPLVALDGSASTHGDQVRAWKARVAPTVLFLGPQGREVASRINGAGLIDFYGAYLDERLAAARTAVRG